MLWLARSRFSRASVYTWATIIAVVLSSGGRPSLTIILLAPLATFLISLAVYVFNDLADLDVDRINAPKRPLVSQSVERIDALLLFLLLNAGGMAIGYLIGFYAFIITIAELMLGLAYSVRPFSLKDRFFVKTLSIGAGGILASLFGGVAAGSVNGSVLYAAAMFLVLLFATSPINDLADYVGDRAQERRTIPIIIGPRKTIWLAMLAAVAPFASSLTVLPVLGLNVLTPVLFGLMTVRAIRLLMPLFGGYTDHVLVRRQHRRMVPLHLLLQGALALGVLPVFPMSTD